MLRTRLLVGGTLAGVALIAFLSPGVVGALVFFALAVAMIHVAVREFFALTLGMGYRGYPVLTSLAGVLLLAGITMASQHPEHASTAVSCVDEWLLPAFIVCAFVLAFREFGRDDALMPLFVTLAGFFCICWTLSCIPRLFYSGGMDMEGRYLVLFLVAVTKLGDVGAYVVGKSTAALPSGNHKIAPTLSPKKSWEGLFGGMAASVLGAVWLAKHFGSRLSFAGVPVLSPGRAVVLGVLFALLGFAGDLAESSLKRAAGAKDSGHLPGLGGALDVLDSLLFVSPFFLGYVRLMALLDSDPIMHL